MVGYSEAVVVYYIIEPRHEKTSSGFVTRVD